MTVLTVRKLISYPMCCVLVWFLFFYSFTNWTVKEWHRYIGNIMWLIDILSHHWRQRERLHATGVFICSSVCLFVCLSIAKLQKCDFCKKLSNLELWSLLTTY